MKRPEPLQRASDDVVPIPDPTYMTRAAMDRLFDRLKEIIDLNIKERENVTNVHFEGIDHQFKHLTYQIGSQAKECEQLVNTLKELTTERIRSIENQLIQKDAAWTAAQSAAKEGGTTRYEANAMAIDKAQASTEKQLDSLRAQMSAEKKASDDKVDDIRNRLTSMESAARGSKETHHTTQTNTMNTASIVGIVIAAALGLASFIVSLLTRVAAVP